MNRTDSKNMDIKFVKKFDFIEKYDERESQVNNEYCSSYSKTSKINNKMCNISSASKNNLAFSEFVPTQNSSQLVRPEQHIQLIANSLSDICDDLQPVYDDLTEPLSKRWSPVGANCDDSVNPISELPTSASEMKSLKSNRDGIQDVLHSERIEMFRLRNLEEEQEILASSLMALTSHFAHLQLRVRQIVEAPCDERDQLLKNLEEFAFQGIPEPLPPEFSAGNGSQYESIFSQPTDVNDEIIFSRQFKLIGQLKSQLSQLEKFAYDSGAPVLPQHVLLEKQKIIIDELKNKLNLKVQEQDLPDLSPEELKCQVDSALGEFIGPLKMKEQLVTQLKTQIMDLERFIAYLQCDSDDLQLKTLNNNGKLNEAYNSYAAKKKTISARKKFSTKLVMTEEDNTISIAHVEAAISNNAQRYEHESFRNKLHRLIDKTSLLMQMFSSTHFGKTAHQFQKNSLKKTSKGNHWGDLRAQLEIDIQKVSLLAATLRFDHQKIANTKRSAKKLTKVAKTNQNRTFTTFPYKGTRNRKFQLESSEIRPYHVSSDSEEDISECYNWDGNSSRITHSFYHRDDSTSSISRELSATVRKNLAMTLMQLIQHGLRVGTESTTSSMIIPFMRCLNPSAVFGSEHNLNAKDADNNSFVTVSLDGCTAHENINIDADNDSFNFFRNGLSRQMHAWELILEYYYINHGAEYNNTPARKLSDSFNLDIVDSHTVSVKQNLLMVIGMIIAIHRPYKRSFNAHFKAFVCAGLNSHKLVEWLSLIFSCTGLIASYYTSESYVVRTGFRDSLCSIGTLNEYDFDLPVDLAVRHFKNI